MLYARSILLLSFLSFLTCFNSLMAKLFHNDFKNYNEGLFRGSNRDPEQAYSNCKSNDESRNKHYNIFKDHPEVFRLQSEKNIKSSVCWWLTFEIYLISVGEKIRNRICLRMKNLISRRREGIISIYCNGNVYNF